MKYKKVIVLILVFVILFANIITVNGYYFDGGVELIPPCKTTYYEGDTLDLTGMEIYGYCGYMHRIPNDDGSTSWVPSITQKESLEDVVVDLACKPLTMDDKVVTVEGFYVWYNTTLHDTFEITVLPLPDYKTTIVSNSFEKGKDVENGVVEFTVNNDTDEEKEIMVLLGIYDSDDNMVCLKIQSLKAKSGDNSGKFENINIKDMKPGEYTAKILCLNDMNTLSPLAFSAEFSFGI